MSRHLGYDRIDAAAINGVRWGTRSTLTAAVSYFPELEVLENGRNGDVPEDEMRVSGM